MSAASAFIGAFVAMSALMLLAGCGVLFAVWMGRGGPWGQSQG